MSRSSTSSADERRIRVFPSSLRRACGRVFIKSQLTLTTLDSLKDRLRVRSAVRVRGIVAARSQISTSPCSPQRSACDAQQVARARNTDTKTPCRASSASRLRACGRGKSHVKSRRRSKVCGRRARYAHSLFEIFFRCSPLGCLIMLPDFLALGASMHEPI
jgi:hypothetical protein